MFRRRFARFGGFGGPWALASCGPGFGGHGYGGCGGHGYDGDEGRGRGRYGWGRGGGLGGSFWLRALFARLDTTPGQEREIRSAIEDFQKTAREAKDDMKNAREDLARAIGGETFDEIAIGEANVRADNAARTIKDALEASLKRVHAVLDPKQRERLAELISKGPRFGGRGPWGNPYRDAAM